MRAYSLGIFLLIAYLVYVVNGKNKMEELPTHGENKEFCPKVRNELNDQKSKTMCKPRMVLVKLMAEPGYTYFPDVVSVNRCHGFCYNDISCMPVASNKTSVVVKRQHISSSKLTCHRVFVEEHTECKCLCNVMAQHCNKNQMYLEDECACKCINMADKRKCNAMANRRWNPETCSCMCDMAEQECSTGLQWIPRFCKCLRIMDERNLID